MIILHSAHLLISILGILSSLAYFSLAENIFLILNDLMRYGTNAKYSENDTKLIALIYAKSFLNLLVGFSIHAWMHSSPL